MVTAVMRTMKRLLIVLATVTSLVPTAWADWQMNMSTGVTPISKSIYHLHMTVLYVCIAIGVVVFGVMIYALIMHRKSLGHKAASFHENTKVEIIWAIVPFIILLALAIPATRVLIAMANTQDADVTIKIIGHQWKWQYQYLDEGISFFSNLSTPYAEIIGKAPKNKWYLLEVDNPVVVPANKKIRFLVTSNDVIHSWWVPELGIKRDAIPGFIHEAWAKIDHEGIFRGQCAELCGINHAYMPIVVKAVSDAEYQAWVNEHRPAAPSVVTILSAGNQIASAQAAAKPWTQTLAMTQGKEVYEKYCIACHQQNGEGLPGVFKALKGSSVAVGKPIGRHIKTVLNGVGGTAMQAFGSQLTDEQLAAVITYERNAWGNNTGDLVTPADVAKER